MLDYIDQFCVGPLLRITECNDECCGCKIVFEYALYEKWSENIITPRRKPMRCEPSLPCSHVQKWKYFYKLWRFVQRLSIPLILYCIEMNGLSIVPSSVVKSRIRIPNNYKSTESKYHPQKWNVNDFLYISLFWEPVISRQVFWIIRSITYQVLRQCR